MPKTYTPPQAFETTPRPPIAHTPVEPPSSQIATRGYDAATQTLVLTFTRGPGSIYLYPNVDAETWAAFLAADSAGKFFGSRIKTLPFKKYPAEPAAEATA